MPWQRVRRTYLVLLLLNSLAVSFIWGVNSLLLLDAGLSNAQALTANAFFTLGYALFEIPTGSIADTFGRRASYLLGGGTLSAGTLLYWLAWRLHASVWGWAAVSFAMAIGFTFFSGATDAWLVDALHSLGFTGHLEHVFAVGQVAIGIGTLTGSLAGAVVAQLTNIGVPFLIRAGLLVVLSTVAWRIMHDLGFQPGGRGHPLYRARQVVAASITYGWRNAAVRLVTLAAFCTSGVGYYVAFMMKPYLLQLDHDRRAYSLLGVAVALGAAAQIAGGTLAMSFRSLFRWRMSVLIAGMTANIGLLVGFGLTRSVPLAVGLFATYGLISAGVVPSRQAYLNALLPGPWRASVLSFDSLVSSAGAATMQPGLGRSADVWGYPASFVLAGSLQLLSLPFLVLARRREAYAGPDTTRRA